MDNVWIFVQIESDDDVLWTADVREKNEDVASRGMKFMNWYVPMSFYKYRNFPNCGIGLNILRKSVWLAHLQVICLSFHGS